jgi:microcompartment protein CcmL/EutN
MISLGLVETRSIARGIDLLDRMVKRAGVEALRAQTICSGRYMIIISGDRAAVGEAMKGAGETGDAVHAQHLISRAHEQIVAALANRISLPAGPAALAIIECRNVVSGIEAADAAVKSATVQLARMVFGQGINGKSYFILCGDVSAVEAAADAAQEKLGKNLIEKIIIPSPDQAVMRTVLAGGR